MSIKVLIADDQVILRESLKYIIEQDSGIEVLGCAGNGLEALGICRKTPPDVVLMDIYMPVCDGIEGTRLIREQCAASIKVLVLTTFDDEKNVEKAMQSGADGYLLKDILPEELVLAIKSTAKGMTVLHQSALKKVLKNPAGDVCRQAEKNVEIDLTEREKRLIQLIIDGKSNREIAQQLSFTEGTVKNMITGILEKFKLRDRTQLAVYAIKNNLEYR